MGVKGRVGGDGLRYYSSIGKSVKEWPVGDCCLVWSSAALNHFLKHLFLTFVGKLEYFLTTNFWFVKDQPN